MGSWKMRFRGKRNSFSRDFSEILSSGLIMNSGKSLFFSQVVTCIL